MGSRTSVGDSLPQQEAASFVDLIYDTGDEPISVAVWSERECHAPAQAVGRPNWLDNPRFRTVADRQRNIDARLALTQEVLLARTARPRLAGAARHRRRAMHPVLTRNATLDDRQVRAHGIVTGLDHPRAFQAPRRRSTRPRRTTGANAEAVLREVGVKAGRFAPTSPHGCTAHHKWLLWQVGNSARWRASSATSATTRSASIFIRSTATPPSTAATSISWNAAWRGATTSWAIMGLPIWHPGPGC
ncbi:hypothetical protein D3272_04280 [Lichenibacterium ramalinae]|uniref:Uncharacterized protein n=1 Tax=Lichenibacterium ramalinae TaxID=2316527 RepID=A0A4Q2RGE3_9HYPH|nr:hypothetical protein D3272_04280 [Lichenibacterium ramalinae]